MALLTKYANSHTAITGGYTNPGNAYADDANYATANPAKNSEISAYFGFPVLPEDLPENITVNSVNAVIAYNVDTAGSIANQYLQLFNNSAGKGTELDDASEPTTDSQLTQGVTSGIGREDILYGGLEARLRSARGNTNTAVAFSIKYVRVEIDYTINGAAYTHTVNDSVTPSDSRSNVIAFSKTFGETATASESTSSVKTFTRVLSDSITASEYDSKAKVFQRSLSDTVVPSESRTTASGVERSKVLADSVTASESTSIASSNSMSGKIAALATRIGQEAKALWTAISGKSDASHTHAGVYEPVISKATGYLKWNGSVWVFVNETYSLSSHNHTGVYQPLDADLTSIAALAGTSGLLRKTAANTWTLDTATYLTAITKAMVEAVLTGAITTHTHAYEPPISKATGYLRWTGSAWQFLNETYSLSTHNHAGVYEPVFTKNTAFNKNYGTVAGTVTQGNDSRLSDTRTPTDATVTYAKLATDLTSRNAVAASDIDWNAGGVFTKTIAAITTFTFSNLKLNKVITLVLTGNFAITLPTYCKKISGTYDGAVSNYIQFHCTNATGASEEVWYVINQAST